MKKKIFAVLATIGMTFSILLGATGISVATAEPAEAATKSRCYSLYEYKGYPWSLWGYDQWCYVNYNWWEETFQPTKWDRWERTGHVGYWTHYSHNSGRGYI